MCRTHYYNINICIFFIIYISTRTAARRGEEREKMGLSNAIKCYYRGTQREIRYTFRRAKLKQIMCTRRLLTTRRYRVKIVTVFFAFHRILLHERQKNLVLI